MNEVTPMLQKAKLEEEEWEKPIKTYPDFILSTTKLTWNGETELGTTVVGGEYLTACPTEQP